MNEAIENVCVKKNDNMLLRGRRARARLPCYDRGDGDVGNEEGPCPHDPDDADGGQMPIPPRAPGGFVVDLPSPTGPLDREEAGLLDRDEARLVLSWL